MADKSLLKYIKQNLADGFSETQIREALLEAGWQEAEITQGFREKNFWSKYRKALLPVLIILAISPIAGFGGFWAYQQISLEASKEKIAGVTAAPSAEDEAQAQKRDRQRVTDIQNLQTKLASYFQTHKVYPQTLKELGEIPLDPKSEKPYLYIPLGNPALYYSLSLILETNFPPYRAGLVIVSSDLNH